MAQMFRKILLDFRYDNRVFRKYYHSVNSRFTNVSYKNANTNLLFENKVSLSYFLSDRKVSMTRGTSHRGTRTCLLKGPLCSQSSIRNSVNCYCPTVNGIKHFSDAAQVINAQSIVFNNPVMRSMCASLPVECIMDVMRAMHTTIGLPWWATIILTSTITKTVIGLPLYIMQQRDIAMLHKIDHELQDVKEKLQKQMNLMIFTTQCNPQEAIYNYNKDLKEQRQESIRRNNCHQFKPVAVALLKMPLYLAFTCALMNLCLKLPNMDDLAEQDYLALVSGGFGWVKDLTDRDHTYALSATLAVLCQGIIYVRNVGMPEPSKLHKKLLIVMRVFSLALPVLTAHLPSGVILYFTVNVVNTFLHSFLLKSPQIRRLVRIPKTSYEPQRPYSEMYKQVKSGFGYYRNRTK